jgi:hypothetical protein
VKTFEGTIIATGYDAPLRQIQFAPDGDIIGFYYDFGGSDDEEYPAFVEFDLESGTQQMAYWYNGTTNIRDGIGTVDKDGNIWFVGYDQ